MFYGKLLSANSVSLVYIGLSGYLFLEWILVVYVFQGIDPFLVSCRFMDVIWFPVFSYYPFNGCEIYSNVASLIVDIGNRCVLCSLFFSLVTV